MPENKAKSRHLIRFDAGEVRKILASAHKIKFVNSYKNPKDFLGAKGLILQIEGKNMTVNKADKIFGDYLNIVCEYGRKTVDICWSVRDIDGPDNVLAMVVY